MDDEFVDAVPMFRALMKMSASQRRAALDSLVEEFDRDGFEKVEWAVETGLLSQVQVEEYFRLDFGYSELGTCINTWKAKKSHTDDRVIILTVKGSCIDRHRERVIQDFEVDVMNQVEFIKHKFDEADPELRQELLDAAGVKTLDELLQEMG